MRDVLVITPDFPPEVGGIQTLSHRLVSGFTRYRPRVVAPAMRGSSQFDEMLPFRVRRSGSEDGRRQIRVLSLNLVALLEGFQRTPDAILSMHIVSAPAALAAGRILHRPVLLYTHAQELSLRPRLARQTLARSSAVVAVSRYTKRMVERLGVDAKRIRVVHPGVDEPREDVAVRSEADQAVIVVARLEERYKGHDVLLRSMPLVCRQVPEARLHVVGDGSLRPELEQLAQGLGIARATTFHGSLVDDERDTLLRKSAVFAMPSRVDSRGAGEGFGIVYIEAGAHALPVVAGKAAGAIDAVLDGKTGLLVDPEDPTAVADAISTLLLDRETARRMGRAGWERAKTLSWSQAAADVETLLDEVTAI
jgi:phosphatidylinositol alpha-1,6-mannosyltransferase